MADNYENTKKNLKEWMKVSWTHLQEIKDSFISETKKLIDEAREEFKKEQAKKAENSQQVD